jgi:hypothetical protein
MYSIESFYGGEKENPKGLSDSLHDIEDWDRVVETAHEWISDGGFVRITDEESGKSITLDFDSYFEDFEGEFPLSPDDFKIQENEYERY